jgi:hypothetical protein
MTQQFIIGVSTQVCANLMIRAESAQEAWEKAKAWQLTEQENESVYLDEDRFIEDMWKLDSIEPIGD